LASAPAPATIELPAHWGRWQRSKNTVIFHAARAGMAIARAQPFFVLSAFGAFGGAMGFLFSLTDRRRAVEQIRRAMPELKRPHWTIFRMFVHLGRVGAEFAKMDRYTAPDSPHVIFDDATRRTLDAALAEGKGVLCFTPHLGNWELYAQVAAARGYVCATVAKKSYDPRLTHLIHAFRTRGGLVVHYRGDVDVMQTLRARLQMRGFVGMLIDQDTRVPSVFVPFFGRPASTPVVPAWIGVQQGSPVLFGCAVREGARYRVTFERVPVPLPTDEPEFFAGLAQARALTAEITRRTEDAIRKHPHQWVWLHARWKRQP
jgi:KDO2-lipid IV(A) lauroyltransferase